MRQYEKVTNIVDSHELVNWDKAPEWANWAGRDVYGWCWFEKHPMKFDRCDLVKGMLRSDQGKFIQMTGFHKSAYGGELLAVRRHPETIDVLALKAERDVLKAEQKRIQEEYQALEEKNAARLAEIERMVASVGLAFLS